MARRVQHHACANRFETRALASLYRSDVPARSHAVRAERCVVQQLLLVGIPLSAVRAGTAPGDDVPKKQPSRAKKKAIRKARRAWKDPDAAITTRSSRRAPTPSRRERMHGIHQGASRQLAFRDPPRRGGARPGSGPKPRRRPRVRHRTRPEHKYWNALHITMRIARGIPSLRSQLLYAVIEGAVRATRRDGFRIVEFSVQDDHLHVAAEADDKDRLSRGMRSFAVRIARRVNKALHRRRGRVFDDRYHRRDLRSPRQVRNALVYVLANVKKHYRLTHGLPTIDPCSSAPWFDGWSTTYPRTQPPPTASRPTELPRTLLLAKLWRKHGLIDPTEMPKLPN